MKKIDRVTFVSNAVLFIIIAGLKYLYRLEYQRGYLDGINSTNCMSDEIMARNGNSGSDHRVHAFAEELSMRGMI